MKKSRRRRMMITVLVYAIIGVFLLTVGPLVINHVFVAETFFINNIAFDAGNLLDYYGAVLGGLVTCFAIISAVQLNNQNIREERQRAQFERAYEVYHKLPEILAKMDSAAIHLRYSVHISESELMETIDNMEEYESILREQHYVNVKYFNKTVDTLLRDIIDASNACQDITEKYLVEKEEKGEDYDPPHNEMEAASTKLRDAIESAKGEIMIEINKFMNMGEELD